MLPLTDNSQQLVFVGSYTVGAGGEGVGISAVVRDARTGSLGPVAAVAASPAPSFVAQHPTVPVLYAVNELPEGSVSAFGIAADGALSPLGSWPTGGAHPCHLAVDAAADVLVVANYGSGSLSAFGLDAAGLPIHHSAVAHEGRGQHPERQEGPHAHMVAPSEDGILAVDLGLDTVYFYPIDPTTGHLGEREVAIRLPPGTGPRHLAKDRSGVVHVVGELDASVNTYERSAAGWRQVARVSSTVSEESLPSHIALSADERFLYVANRGPDTVAVFALTSGVPDRVGEVSSGGAWPRHFAVVDEFLYVANERSHTVATFRLDPVTGMPTPTGDVLATPSPTCILPW